MSLTFAAMAQDIFDRIKRRRQSLKTLMSKSDRSGSQVTKLIYELKSLDWVMRLYYEHRSSMRRKVLTEKYKKIIKRKTIK